MEIERKWDVSGWPELDLPLIEEHRMRQGYLNVRPTVRIREEAKTGGSTSWILCLKSAGTIVREEIEIEIDKETFDRISAMIGIPLIEKTRRTYLLSDGMHLEVNHVDDGLPTEFWYAEVEFESVEQAVNWDPAAAGAGEYLQKDVSEESGNSMGAFWEVTRLGLKEQDR